MTRTTTPRVPDLRRRRRLALAGGLAVMSAVGSLSGCALFFDEPDVRIAAVRVVEVGITGATAELDLSVVNPNRFALTSRGLRYRLSFLDVGDGNDWTTIAEGTSDEVVRVEGHDSTRVAVRVPFRYSDVGRAVGSLLRTGELRYRLLGDVIFDGPVGDVRIPFDDTGDVAL